jgi:hypothetical protein
MERSIKKSTGVGSDGDLEGHNWRPGQTKSYPPHTVHGGVGRRAIVWGWPRQNHKTLPKKIIEK